jgi:hypothetical protein
MCLNLRPGVRRRTYPDGVVVYVAETCETHILAPDFEALLKPPCRVLLVEEPGVLQARVDDSDATPTIHVSRAFIDELSRLKIIDRST